MAMAMPPELAVADTEPIANCSDSSFCGFCNRTCTVVHNHKLGYNMVEEFYFILCQACSIMGRENLN
jgi:hypothetical protein